VGWFPERDPRGAYTLRAGRQEVAGTDIELTSAHPEVVRDAIELCLNRLNEGAPPAEIQRLLDEALAAGGGPAR
jgi:hypothetical protein